MRNIFISIPGFYTPSSLLCTQSELLCIERNKLYAQTFMVCIRSIILYVQTFALWIGSAILCTQTFMLWIGSAILYAQTFILCAQTMKVCGNFNLFLIENHIF